MPSIFPPTITLANGNPVKNGDKISGSSATFEGTGFPGKDLTIDVNNGYTPAKQTVTVDSNTGIWKITLSPLKAGNTTITVTETITNPGTISLTFEVLSAILENFDNEDLRSYDEIQHTIITANNIAFYQSGNAYNDLYSIGIKTAAEAAFGLSKSQYESCAGKLENKVFDIRTTDSRFPSTHNIHIFLLKDKNATLFPENLRAFSKVSFWYYCRLPLFEVFAIGAAGSALGSPQKMKQGLNQMTFDISSMIGIVLTTNQINYAVDQGHSCFLDSFEFTPA